MAEENGNIEAIDNGPTTISGDLKAAHAALLEIGRMLGGLDKIHTLRVVLPVLAREIKEKGVRDVASIKLRKGVSFKSMNRHRRLTRPPTPRPLTEPEQLEEALNGRR